MKIPNLVFCTVEVEFMFCYGCFGYGYSHQLKHPEMDFHRSLKHSMFIRVPPPEDRTHPHSNDTTAEPMRYPSFLSPNLNMKDAHCNKGIPAVSNLSSEDVETLQKGLNELSSQTRQEINFSLFKLWNLYFIL
ncbi:cation channel sperm-associated targeting subunit tau-like [Apteryx mantelli]|uniref:Cation channel sperm-associated targeting subunit tau-like n=1 Tax=Apteryx mantelli TaxID=2696672 RepID=A0ABM4EPU7_9AVES